MQSTWADSGCLKEDSKFDDFKHLIMHCSLPLNDKFTLMASDHHPAMEEKNLVAGNNSEIVLIPDSKAEADRLFAALSDGGSVKMPMQDMFWGSYSGNCTDKFGIHWLIDTPSGGDANAAAPEKPDEETNP
jgi:PhnB protein